MSGVALLIGALIGYALGAFTFRDEAQFWQSRADFWYENSTKWMRSALSCVEIRHRCVAPRETEETPE